MKREGKIRITKREGLIVYPCEIRCADPGREWSRLKRGMGRVGGREESLKAVPKAREDFVRFFQAVLTARPCLHPFVLTLCTLDRPHGAAWNQR